jgi:hypothetical protein
MSTPPGTDRDQYRKRAKELVKQVRAAHPDALERIRTNHPEHVALIGSGEFKLADAQLVVAREAGFPSWPKLKAYVAFRNAVDALDGGDLKGLEAIVRANPAVLTYRCQIGEWYETGYFEGATLLTHVAGNPIRRPLPANILDVTRLLLTLGADPNSSTAKGWTTIGLILTGKQVADAGVGVKLIDLLKGAGASDDIGGDDILSPPLFNCGRATAEELAARGAKMRLWHAAGLGRIDEMRRLLIVESAKGDLELALFYATFQREKEAARFLVEQGAVGDVLIDPKYATRATALHNAAGNGDLEIVQLLVTHGARADIVEPTFHGTALGWARHAGHSAVAEYLERHGGR